MPVAWGNWVAHAVPDEPESAGGLQVAAIQFGMTLGAGLGGLAFDYSGSTGLLLGSGAALLAGALLIWKGLNHQTAPAPEPLDVGERQHDGMAWRGDRMKKHALMLVSLTLWSLAPVSLAQKATQPEKTMNITLKIGTQTLQATLTDSATTRDFSPCCP